MSYIYIKSSKLVTRPINNKDVPTFSSYIIIIKGFDRHQRK